VAMTYHLYLFIAILLGICPVFAFVYVYVYVYVFVLFFSLSSLV
jgi:hypothetical protein